MHECGGPRGLVGVPHERAAEYLVVNVLHLRVADLDVADARLVHEDAAVCVDGGLDVRAALQVLLDRLHVLGVEEPALLGVGRRGKQAHGGRLAAHLLVPQGSL